MDQSDRIVISKLKKIAIISLVFMTIEIVGGALAHSIAIMADAFHLLSDVIAYVISLYAVLLSKRIAPKHLAFGYQKAQPLGALINVAIIWCVTVQLFIEATHRIIDRQVVQQPLFMLLTSIFGLGCNLYIMKILHSEEGGHDHHGHSHGHSHSHAHNGHNELNEEHQLEKQLSHGKNESIEAVCSCNSPDQINRSTKGSYNHKDSSNIKEIDLKELQSPFPIQLNQGLVPKNKGYCALHSGQGKNPHDYEHDHHDHDHQDNNGHSHGQGGCSHGHHLKVFENINIQAAYIHIISDIILSIGVIISASIIYFVAGNDTQWSAWQLADPFCTYLFSIVALFSTVSIIKESMVLLMDGCENPEILAKTDQFIRTLKSQHPEIEVEELKVWSSNRGKYYCAMRIVMKRAFVPLSGQMSEQKLVVKLNDSQQSIYQKVQSFCKSKKMTCYIDINRK